MAHYLVYWKPDTVDSHREMECIGHTASEQYGKLVVGDVLWIVSSPTTGRLTLIGKQNVDRIVDQEEAESLFREGLWEANYHVICDDPEPTYRGDITEIARQLRFDGKVDRLPDNFSGQHFQSMRKLKRESTALIEEYWKTVRTS